MYFELYFIAGIVIFGLVLYKFIELLFDSHSYSKKYTYIYAILLFFVLIATFANIIVTIYSYRTTINVAGQPGDKGIRGTQGYSGDKGKCDDKCGQKVCYVSVIDHANKIFHSKVNEVYKQKATESKEAKDAAETAAKAAADTAAAAAADAKAKAAAEKNLSEFLGKDKKFKIKNGKFLQILNNICKSDKYQSIMLGKHPNKPSEQQLINYIKDIVEEWIIHLCSDTDKQQDKQIQFLLEPHWDINMLNYTNSGNTKNPFNELMKYDIWNWGETDLVINPINNQIDIKNLDKPEPDTARLYIQKSNNYKKEFDSTTQKDKWDDTKCSYGQMGKDKTNPQNLSKCVFINDSYLKDYNNTWKTDVYRKDKELSLYNSEKFTNKNKQEFYPVGSVWRGKDDDSKPSGANNSPIKLDDTVSAHKKTGPEKETILVSGDVVPPERYDLIWNNKAGCKDCQNESVKIYRPVAPKGYVCLGDYAVSGNTKKSTTELTSMIVYYDEKTKKIKVKVIEQYTLDKLKDTENEIETVNKTIKAIDHDTELSAIKPTPKNKVVLVKYKSGRIEYLEDTKNSYPEFFTKELIEKAVNSVDLDKIYLDDEAINIIRCVPKECVREKKLGSNFWNNKNISYDRYNSYETYIAKTPFSSETQLGSSFWAAGVDSVGSAEEQRNLYGYEFEDDNGYNLFRLNKGFKEPYDQKTYTIKEECLIPGSGKEPVHPKQDIDKLLEGNYENHYSTKAYFGKKPGMAILTNIEESTDKSIFNFNNKPIKIYLIDDLTVKGSNQGQKIPDTYFLSTFNETKNDFSKYIITNKNDEIQFTESPNKQNKYHRWYLHTDITVKSPLQDTRIYSYGLNDTTVNNKILYHYYDNLGKSRFDIKTVVNIDYKQWKYSSMMAVNQDSFSAIPDNPTYEAAKAKAKAKAFVDTVTDIPQKALAEYKQAVADMVS